jgi:collagenase-like PrtC family protease
MIVKIDGSRRRIESVRRGLSVYVKSKLSATNGKMEDSPLPHFFWTYQKGYCGKT